VLQRPHRRPGRVIYSNVVDSHCSSRGLAKVSYAYTGTFGRAYKLVGLQPGNSRIFERNIVLHAHGCVPAEPQLGPICRSQGCPTVNPAFLKVLSRYIDRSPRPLLLYIR
jgi:L,D-transpeptidase catalytic domain